MAKGKALPYPDPVPFNHEFAVLFLIALLPGSAQLRCINTNCFQSAHPAFLPIKTRHVISS